jgi:hypothetical protein
MTDFKTHHLGSPPNMIPARSQEKKSMPSGNQQMNINALLSDTNMGQYRGVRSGKQSQNISMMYQGKPLDVKFINSGGTKEVYQAVINGESRAIAIPGWKKAPRPLAESWRNALKEPEQIELLRKLGIKVNDHYSIQPLTVDGVDIPAIFMKPYDKHDFIILDKKNPSQNPHINYPSEAIDSQSKLMDSVSGMVSDITKLVSNSITLDGDSVNTAVVDGKPRLFINDINGNIVNKKLTKEENARHLIRVALGGYIETIIYNGRKNPSAFMESALDISSGGYDNLVEDMLKKVMKAV